MHQVPASRQATCSSNSDCTRAAHDNAVVQQRLHGRVHVWSMPFVPSNSNWVACRFTSWLATQVTIKQGRTDSPCRSVLTLRDQGPASTTSLVPEVGKSSANHPSLPAFLPTALYPSTITHYTPTLRKAAAPWLMMQSRSISPNRSPPSLARPSTGCLLRTCAGSERRRECEG
jgi:hypothetical protein